MNDANIITEIKKLIREGNSIANGLQTSYDIKNYGKLIIERKGSIKKWECYTLNILRLRFNEKSEFYKQYELALSSEVDGVEYYRENIELAVGVLEFIQESMEKGLTDDLFYRREIILFSDMLRQAEEFLEKKIKLAAAIYGRIILELTIIEFAKKNRINTDRKFDEIIIDLRKNEIIHQPFEISLRSNYKIGSMAAHADEKFNSFSESEIREFLSFIRDKVLTLE